MKKQLLLAAALGLSFSMPSWATSYTSTDVPKAIPDLTTVTSTLTIGDHVFITDVDVWLTNLRHTFDGDLDIFLISPLGTTVELTTDNGGSGDNFINTIFDDDAVTSITAGVAPFTGSFRPESALSAFNGQDAFGLWTLRITDDAGADIGTLNAWSLDIDGRTTVPEPASIALLGMGLMGLGWSRRALQRK